MKIKNLNHLVTWLHSKMVEIIYQWAPDKPIMEWTHQTIIKGKLRGNHYHQSLMNISY